MRVSIVDPDAFLMVRVIQTCNAAETEAAIRNVRSMRSEAAERLKAEGAGEDVIDAAVAPYDAAEDELRGRLDHYIRQVEAAGGTYHYHREA